MLLSMPVFPVIDKVSSPSKARLRKRNALQLPMG